MGKRPGPWSHIVRHHVALPYQAIFVDDQPIQPYRAPSVCFIGTDTYLRAFAKPKAICKTCRGIMHDGRRVHLLQELGGRLWGFCENGIGMPGAVLIDVGNSLLQAVNNAQRNDKIEIFGIPIFYSRLQDVRENRPRRRASAHLHTRFTIR
jgi:hypothetical protein